MSSDIIDWVARPLDPGEKPCPVRSSQYKEPTPHLRLYGSYGRCLACRNLARSRRKDPLRWRISDWWNKRRYQRSRR